ncbi:MAG: hypothetical protein WDZ40_01645 [Candidatus Spechtbacterales bacterium]
MEEVLNIYKPAGMTPLEAVKLFREEHPKYDGLKMTYAGRLDPLAEGVLLVLVGDELKQQEKYWDLDKEYEADILFGVSTDTYDVLGIPAAETKKSSSQVPRSDFSRASTELSRMSENTPLRSRRKTPNGDQAQLQSRSSSERSRQTLFTLLEEFKGEYTFSFPPYSSRRVKGKPLFWWARNGRLDEIEIPKKTVQIYKIELVENSSIKKSVLVKQITEKVDSVRGDFRQEEIKNAWKELLENSNTDDFSVIKIKVACSSGTYIRSIAHDVGEKLGTGLPTAQSTAQIGAVLLSLKRTRVGEHTVNDSIKI